MTLTNGALDYVRRRREREVACIIPDYKYCKEGVLLGEGQFVRG